MNVFRIFDPKGPKQDPNERRRQQLRQSQRTFREKGLKYTKSLEEELLRTRSNHAYLIEECENMRDTIKSLVELLEECGGDIPSDIWNNSHPERPDRTGIPSSKATHYTRKTTGLKRNHAPASVSFSSPGVDSPQTVTSSTTNDNVEVRLCDLDPATIGMEFVLSVENPCLGHLHGDPQHPEKPSGHALTTSSQLVCMTQSDTNVQHQPTTISCENVPAVILENLLSLSTSMCSENEMTPAQAWQAIRLQPYFGGFGLSDLRNLAQRLRESVKCHGYGAVLQVQTFQTMMFECLVLGRAF